MSLSSRREFIRQTIRRRVASGQAITVRQVQKETGGSLSTISEELRAITEEIPNLVSGSRTRSTPERIRNMQGRIEDLQQENAGLKAQVASLENALKLFRDELASLMGQMTYSSKQTLLGLDEVRQTVVKISQSPAAPPTSKKISGEIIFLENKLSQVSANFFHAQDENKILRFRNEELEEELAAYKRGR